MVKLEPQPLTFNGKFGGVIDSKDQSEGVDTTSGTAYRVYFRSVQKRWRCYNWMTVSYSSPLIAGMQAQIATRPMASIQETIVRARMVSDLNSVFPLIGGFNAVLTEGVMIGVKPVLVPPDQVMTVQWAASGGITANQACQVRATYFESANLEEILCLFAGSL